MIIAFQWNQVQPKKNMYGREKMKRIITSNYLYPSEQLDLWLKQKGEGYAWVKQKSLWANRVKMIISVCLSNNKEAKRKKNNWKNKGSVERD